MSYRFTDSEKWKDIWFRKLSINEKILFIYFIDNCNLSGFIELDIESIAFSTGLTKSDILGAKEGLNKSCFEADNWIWIKNFLKHQKNLPLNSSNNAHKHIIGIIKEQLQRFSCIPEFMEFVNKNIPAILGANQGLFSPIGKGKGNGNVLINTENIKKLFAIWGVIPDLTKIQLIENLLKTYDYEAVKRAFYSAVEYDKKNIAYLRGILNNNGTKPGDGKTIKKVD